MTNLKIVRPGKTLFWPDRFGWEEDKHVRGISGFIVDFDAPLETETFQDGKKTLGGFCIGQEYKFANAPEGCVADEVENPTALSEIKLFERTKSGVTEEKIVEQRAASEGIQAPDEPPPKAKTPERPATIEEVVSGEKEAPMLEPTAEDRERFGDGVEALESEKPKAKPKPPSKPKRKPKA